MEAGERRLGDRVARYTRRVRSVADVLEKRTRDAVRAMSPAERIELAFALGEDDLALYMRVHRVDRPTALAILRSNRQIGRRPSEAARISRP